MHQIRRTDEGGAASSSYPNATLSLQTKVPSTAVPTGASHRPLKLTSPHQEPSLKQQTTKVGKRTLHLLNPMSLFLRRRPSPATASGMQQASIQHLAIPPMALPDGWDPRIRGEGVHDFSAPRTTSPQVRRVPGSQHQLDGTVNDSDRGPGYDGRDGLGSLKAPQTPRPGPRLNSSVTGPSSLSEGDLAHARVDGPHETRPYHPQQSNLPEGYDLGAPGPESLKPPSDIKSSQDSASPRDHVPSSLGGNITFDLDEARPSSEDPEKLPSSASPDLERIGLNRHPATDKAQLNENYHIQPENIPRHMKSNASSRFSFDLVGVESAQQEHLLEEKHRRIMSSKIFRPSRPSQQREMQAAARGSDTESDDGSASVSEYSAVFEEAVPGVNVDATNMEGEAANLSSTLSAFQSAIPGIMALDEAKYTVSDLNPAGPRENNAQLDQDIHIAGTATSESQSLHSISSNVHHVTVDQQVAEGSSTSSPISTIDTNSMTSVPIVDSSDEESHYDDDKVPELFHPELFSASREMALSPMDNVNGQDIPKHDSLFNESEQVLQTSEATVDSTHESSGHNEHARSQVQMDKIITEHVVPTEGLAILWPNSPQPMLLEHGAGIPPLNSGIAVNLLDHTFPVKHNALMEVASAGSAPIPQPPDSISNEPGYGEVPRLKISNSNEIIGNEAFDSFAYDSELEEEGNVVDDDPIIAAANAEALASDSDGFYGQEFGFYANANGSSDSEYALGGFFGSPGNDGLFRSHSGHGVFLEPNLTPITERSEYSTRSSFVFPHLSTTAHPTVQPLPNHGLAQLAARMDSSADDLSLANLQQLRRNAWGGSNGSLGSADSLGGGSLPPRLPPIPHSTPGFSMSTSRLSLTGTADASSCYDSSSDGHLSAPASPTLTQLYPPLNQRDTFGSTESYPPDVEQAPSFNRSEHKTESVRYVKEEDSSGRTRWVVERLKRLESGQVEVVGRELVSGGRI